MKPRGSTILLIIFLLSVGLFGLRSSSADRALAEPRPRPLSDAPWSANLKVNDDAPMANQTSPDIAVDPSGNAYAVWGDFRNGNYDIYFSYRPAGGSWGTNLKVNDDAGTASQGSPAIAVDASGNAHAVWHDYRNGNSDIYFSYRPAGGSWGANAKVNDDLGTAWQRSPAIAVDSSGSAYAVWQDQRNDTGDIYFSYRPAGGSWGANLNVNDDPGTAWQEDPAIAVDPSGNAYAVWAVEPNGDAGLYFSYRPTGGSWGANVNVNDDQATASQDYPAIAVDPSGNAYAVWRDMRNGNYDIYFSYRPAGGSWGTNVKVNDDAGTAAQWSPAIAVDPSGNAYTVWRDQRTGNDIYFSYRPAGGSWGTNVKVNDDGGGRSPAIAVDSSGSAYSVWQDQRNDTGDIYFSYRPAGGSWSANIKVNDDLFLAAQTRPDIAVDASGNAYAVWWDCRYDVIDGDIYFSYRPAGGNWGDNVKVNDDLGTAHQISPAIAVDPPGNAYVVWHDYRIDSENGDIYFSYRPTGGSWGANLMVNDDPGIIPQHDPTIGADSSGNAYAVWQDKRNDDGDIYFSYRPAGGSWGTNLKVNDDAGTAEQQSPAIAVDPPGNAYAVWADERNGNYDIYFSYLPAPYEIYLPLVLRNHRP